MTGRERTLRALNHESLDRTPVAGGLLQNAPYLAARAGVADFWESPRETAFSAFRQMGCDAVLGPVMPKQPEYTTRDARGRATDFTVTHAQPKLTTPEQVAAHAREVDPPEQVRETFEAASFEQHYLELMQTGQRDAGDMLFIPHTLGYAPAFPTSDGPLFAYEAFLMACALYPDALRRLFDHWGALSRLKCEAVARATRKHKLLPLLWIGSDLCDARGPVLSPALLRQLYFPQLARALEPLKAAGLKAVWHTDANYRQIIPDLLAVGLDGFQGLYETPTGVRLKDLARLRTRTGEPPIFFGSLSTVWVLPHADPEGVRREVERCVEAVGPQNGLLLAPSSSIGPEVPDANVDALYDHALHYRPSWHSQPLGGLP